MCEWCLCVCASSSTSSAGDIFSSSLQQQLFHRDKNSDSSHSASLPLPPHSTPLPPPSPLQAVNYIAFTEKVLMSLQTKWWKRNETNGEGSGELLNRDQKGVQIGCNKWLFVCHFPFCSIRLNKKRKGRNSFLSCQHSLPP